MLTDSFILLGMSQLLTTAVYFGIHHRTRTGMLFLALFFSLGCYVSFRHSMIDSDVESVIYLFSLLTPILIYIISRLLFIDGARLKRLDWLLIGYFLLFRMLGGLFLGSADEDASPLQLIAVFIVPLAILIYFSVMAAIHTVQGYKNDLLDNRRILRVYFVFSTLVFVIPRLLMGVIVYSYLLTSGKSLELTSIPGTIETIYLAVLFLAFNQLILRKHEEFGQLFSDAASIRTASAHDSNIPEKEMESVLVKRILHAMEEDRAFACQGITIAELAAKLHVTEQRLRQTINSEMGFRNFNQFLNEYRLGEACELLRNSNLPVSKIAFEVGYSSLSSFNSVFKNQYGLTPTEYRVNPKLDENARASL